MCKKECEEVLKTKIGTIIPVFKNNLKQEVEKILSCVYDCLKPVFVRQSVISYKKYTQDTVEFISNTSFTEGVLKFVEKAAEGNIYDGNASLKTLVLAFCKMKLLEQLQREDRLSLKNKKFAFDNRDNTILMEDESGNALEISAILEQSLMVMEPEDRQNLKIVQQKLKNLLRNR